MKIKKILWATDGSKEANDALKLAKYLAGLTGAEIIGTHVVPLPTVMLFESLSGDEIEFKDWMTGVEDRFSKQFSRVQNDLSKSGIKFEGVLLKGSPSAKIKEFARKRNADLIVMGKHGHGILGSLILGSEVSKVVKASDKPVLITKTKRGKKPQFKNILVPHDLAHKCATALHTAMDIANATGGQIKVIYALRLDMYAQDVPAGALSIVIKQSAAELAKEVDSLAKKYKGPKDVKIKTEVVHGLSAASTISTYAEDNKSDLIVIHTHTKTGITKLIMGSVMEKVVHHSNCSVLALNP